MNPQENVVPESHFDSQQISPAPTSATRPLYWSIRREVWENHSIYMAPLAVAGVILFGFLTGAMKLSKHLRAALPQNQIDQYMAIQASLLFVAFLLILTAFIVGTFYSLDALHGERRDRSILFWKSLPVSDLTTVISKASIPLVVLPLLTVVTILVTQLLILLISSITLTANGTAVRPLWEQLHLFKTPLEVLYALAALALWHAPIYGWLLLVSSWVKRAPLLWAVMPLLAISIFEHIAFHTGYFASFVKYRLTGVMTEAFFSPKPGTLPSDLMWLLTPVKFLSSPDLWIGLAVAAVFLGAAVRLRRYREPI